MPLQPPDAAMVDHLIQQMPTFPKTRNARERRMVYNSQGWVQELNLSRLRLTQVPAGLSQLPQLHRLDLSCNHLTHLPAEVGQLAHLEWLDLSYNQLTHLPAELGRLSQLSWLALYCNHLTHLSAEL